jgi:hypothetical protein
MVIESFVCKWDEGHLAFFRHAEILMCVGMRVKIRDEVVVIHSGRIFRGHKDIETHILTLLIK